MNRNLAPLVVFFIVLIVSHESDASFSHDIWNLHLRFALSKNFHERIAPAPGPSSVSTDKSSAKNSPTPAISPLSGSADGFTTERCKLSPMTCNDKMNMTACLLFAEHDHSVEQYLLIQNDGETSLKVTVMISSIRYKEIQVPKHEAKKVNVSDVPGTPLITLDAGNEKCIIHTEPLTKSGSIFKQFSSNLTHINLVYGSFLLFSIAFVIGGIWACCKMGSKDREGDGVPYQELELADHDSPTNDLEAADGWDQGWDDDWDDLKPTNKLSTTQVKENGSANGIHSNTSDRDGWGNDWDN